MQNRLTAAILVALSLSACGQHPPLRYIAVDRHHIHYATKKPYYAEDFYDSVHFRSWQRRQAEIAGDMRFHHGCYPGHCR